MQFVDSFDLSQISKMQHYLELGGRGGEGKAQTSQRPVGEDLDKEFLTFSDSDSSLRSEFIK